MYVEKDPLPLGRPWYRPDGTLVFDQQIADAERLPRVEADSHTHRCIRVTEQMCGPEVAAELGCESQSTSKAPFLVGLGTSWDGMPCCYRAWGITQEEVRTYVADLHELTGHRLPVSTVL